MMTAPDRAETKSVLAELGKKDDSVDTAAWFARAAGSCGGGVSVGCQREGRGVQASAAKKRRAHFRQASAVMLKPIDAPFLSARVGGGSNEDALDIQKYFVFL